MLVAVPGPCTVAIMPSRTACRCAALSLPREGGTSSTGAHAAAKSARMSLTRCGRRTQPLLASIAVACASCRVVTFQKPWPMPVITVSPGYHLPCWEALAAFHAGDGRIPAISPDRSTPVGLPKP